MACGCKTNKSYDSKENKTIIKNNTKSAFSNYIIRITAFLLSLFLLPIIVIASIWFMLELFLLNKEIDMKKILHVLSSKIKPFNEDYQDEIDDDYDDDYDELTEENYEIIDVEEITPVVKK